MADQGMLNACMHALRAAGIQNGAQDAGQQTMDHLEHVPAGLPAGADAASMPEDAEEASADADSQSAEASSHADSRLADGYVRLTALSGWLQVASA